MLQDNRSGRASAWYIKAIRAIWFCVFPPVKEEHVFKSKEELIKYIEK